MEIYQRESIILRNDDFLRINVIDMVMHIMIQSEGSEFDPREAKDENAVEEGSSEALKPRFKGSVSMTIDEETFNFLEDDMKFRLGKYYKGKGHQIFNKNKIQRDVPTLIFQFELPKDDQERVERFRIESRQIQRERTAEGKISLLRWSGHAKENNEYEQESVVDNHSSSILEKLEKGAQDGVELVQVGFVVSEDFVKTLKMKYRDRIDQWFVRGSDIDGLKIKEYRHFIIAEEYGKEIKTVRKIDQKFRKLSLRCESMKLQFLFIWDIILKKKKSRLDLQMQEFKKKFVQKFFGDEKKATEEVSKCSGSTTITNCRGGNCGERLSEARKIVFERSETGDNYYDEDGNEIFVEVESVVVVPGDSMTDATDNGSVFD